MERFAETLGRLERAHAELTEAMSEFYYGDADYEGARAKLEAARRAVAEATDSVRIELARAPREPPRYAAASSA